MPATHACATSKSCHAALKYMKLRTKPYPTRTPGDNACSAGESMNASATSADNQNTTARTPTQWIRNIASARRPDAAMVDVGGIAETEAERRVEVHHGEVGRRDRAFQVVQRVRLEEMTARRAPEVLGETLAPARLANGMQDHSRAHQRDEGDQLAVAADAVHLSLGVHLGEPVVVARVGGGRRDVEVAMEP